MNQLRFSMLAFSFAVAAVACGGSHADEAASSASAQTGPATDVHTPAVGSAERAAFFEGVRNEFDRLVASHPAVGTKDVEFDVNDGILRIASRNGVNWGFVAARAMRPGTTQPFDYSHAPRDVQLEAQDEEGKPDNNIIAIMKQTNGVWSVLKTSYSHFYFAPGDVAWGELPCTDGAPFGLLEGAVASQADCTGKVTTQKKCNPGGPRIEEMKKVPTGEVEGLMTMYRELDGIDDVKATLESAGFFTVTATIPACK